MLSLKPKSRSIFFLILISMAFSLAFNHHPRGAKQTCLNLEKAYDEIRAEPQRWSIQFQEATVSLQQNRLQVEYQKPVILRADGERELVQYGCTSIGSRTSFASSKSFRLSLLDSSKITDFSSAKLVTLKAPENSWTTYEVKSSGKTKTLKIVRFRTAQPIPADSLKSLSISQQLLDSS